MMEELRDSDLIEIDVSEEPQNEIKKCRKKPSKKDVVYISALSVIAVVSVVTLVFCVKIYTALKNSDSKIVLMSSAGQVEDNGKMYVVSNSELAQANGQEAYSNADIVIKTTSPQTNSSAASSKVSSRSVETTTTTVKTTKAADTTQAAASNGIVNINTADLAALESLNGIGEVKAQSIIDYRNANGYFNSIEEITNVSGIGEKTYEKNKDRMTVN